MNKISVGICAYNEEKNLSHLLYSNQNQKIKGSGINELCLISDGSTDSTNNIIETFKSKRIKNIIKVIGKKRRGKYYRINQYIKKSKGNILILCNGDILPEKNAFEKIIFHFKNKKTVLVTTKGICSNNKNKFMNNMNKIYWDLHHKMSLAQPKGTGLIAFRKKSVKLPRTSVDETYMLSLYNKTGTIKYASNVIYYTKGPAKISELISVKLFSISLPDYFLTL